VNRAPALGIAASVVVSLLAACTPTANSGISGRTTGSSRPAQHESATPVSAAKMRSLLHALTRPAPPCLAAQLRLTYRSVAATRGSDYGVIAIRDIAGDPCELSGQVQLTGMNSAGRAVTNTARSPLPGTVTLGPNASTPPEVTPPPDIIPSPPPGLDGAIWLTDEYWNARNSPAGTPCRPHWIIPSVWRVTLPGSHTFTVANADPSGPVQPARSGGLVICAGKLYDPTLLYFGQPLH